MASASPHRFRVTADHTGSAASASAHSRKQQHNTGSSSRSGRRWRNEGVLLTKLTSFLLLMHPAWRSLCPHAVSLPCMLCSKSRNLNLWQDRRGRSCSSPPHSNSLTCCLLNFLPLLGVSATPLSVPSTFIQAPWLSLSFFLCPAHSRVFLCWLVGWKRWALGHLLELRRLQLLKKEKEMN